MHALTTTRAAKIEEHLSLESILSQTTQMAFKTQQACPE